MTPSIPDKPPSSGYSKLLVASLALNLLFLGLVAGAAIARHRWHGPHELSLGDPSLRGFMRQLPDDRRRAIRSAGEQARQAWRPLRQAVQKARDDYNQAMYAQPLDLPRIEKTLNDLIAAESVARRAGIPVLTGTISQMTPEERNNFQDFRRRHERRFGWRAHGPESDDQPSPPPPAK